MKADKTKVALAVVWIVPFLILVSAIYSRHKHLEVIIKNSPKAYADYITNTVAGWKAKTFVPLDMEDKVGVQIVSLIATNSGQSFLTEMQKHKLQDEFHAFFKAYSTGTYESYCKFRFPTNVGWHWKTNGCWHRDKNGEMAMISATAELDRFFKIGPILGDQLIRYTFYTNYSSSHNATITKKPPEGMDARFKEYVYVHSNFSFYSNYWTGVNFDNSSLVIAKTNDVAQPLPFTTFFPMQEARLATLARPFPNLGYFASSDHFSLLEFDNSIANVVANKGEVLIADAFFYVNTSPPDVPLPILVRFYWSPDDSQWLPGDLVVCSVKTLLFRYPIF